MQNTSQWNTLLPFVVIAVIVLLRIRKMTGLRPMQLHSLWIRPGIIAALAVFILYNAPPHGVLQWLVLAAVLAAGAALGWHQGKLMAISVDQESGGLQVKASALALALFFGVVLLRIGLRPWLTGPASPVHAYVGLVTDSFLVFIGGFTGAQTIEMFIRGRALLAESRQT